MIGIVVPILLLLLLAGAVVWAVGRIRHRSEASDAGATVGQVIVLALLLGVSIVFTVGVAGLVERLFEAGSDLARSGAGDLARNLSFTVVGGPVAILLWAWTRSRVRSSPVTRRSDLWGLYLGAALTVGMIVAAVAAVTLVADLFGADGVDAAGAGGRLIAWGAFWAWHWWVWGRADTAPEQFTTLPLLTASAFGLGLGAGGFGFALGSLLTDAYDTVTSTAVAASGSAIAEGSAAGVVGAVVWIWHWWLRGRHLDQRGGWLVYTLLAGVLGGLVTVLVGAATIVFTTLTWFFDRPAAADAARHFGDVPAALSAIVVGAAVWGYHRSVVRDPERVFATETGRAYRYLQAGIGLVAAAVGVGIVIAAIFQALAGPVAIAGGPRSTLLAGITALIVGGPLWALTWQGIQTAAGTEPSSELRSVWRRVYLVLLFGVAGVVALVTLLVIAFRIFEAVLEGTSLSAFLDGTSTALGLLASTGAVAAYHLAVWRADRGAGVAPERHLTNLLLVSDTDDADLEKLIHEATGAKVVSWRAQEVRHVGVDELPEALGEVAEPRALVVRRGDQAQIVPYRPR